MYTWLHDEINLIKTKQFHLTHLPPFSPPNPAVPKTLLPPSYLLFLAEFGHSKLCRSGRTYRLHIFDTPYIEEWGRNDYVRFGTSGAMSRACFKRDFMSSGAETPVFELDYIDGEVDSEQTHLSFNAWLLDYSSGFKEGAGASRWHEIMEGPLPFTAKENQIIEERKKFNVRIIGFTDNNDLQILVENKSQITLPYLTIDIGTNERCLYEGVWLAIDGLEPGESRIVITKIDSFYKNSIPRENFRLFDLPDPEPEDRETYWEFK